MTSAEFLAFYPQFTGLFPAGVLAEYIRLANARFTDFEEDAEEARRLYAAHKLTLYAKAAPPAGASVSALARAGERKAVTGAKVGEVSVTYGASLSGGAASARLTDLSETEYGLQLLSLLRLHSCPKYIP